MRGAIGSLVVYIFLCVRNDPSCDHTSSTANPHKRMLPALSIDGAHSHSVPLVDCQGVMVSGMNPMQCDNDWWT